MAEKAEIEVWKPGFPILFTPDGDRSNQAFFKLIQEVGRIYDHLNALHTGLSEFDGLFGDPAPISGFWTKDKNEPKTLRPATDEDVIKYLFERTAVTDEPVFIVFDPTSKGILGIPFSNITRSQRLSGGNPTMTADDYSGATRGGTPLMVESDYDGRLSGGSPHLF